MKYTVRQYAETLYDALKDSSAKEQKEIITRFLLAVRKNGDSPRMELVLRAFEKKYLKDNGLSVVDIEMAGAVPESVKKEIKSIFAGNFVLSEKEIPELFGGVRITVNGELLIDASVKRQIKRVFS